MHGVILRRAVNVSDFKGEALGALAQLGGRFLCKRGGLGSDRSGLGRCGGGHRSGGLRGLGGTALQSCCRKQEHKDETDQGTRKMLLHGIFLLMIDCSPGERSGKNASRIHGGFARWAVFRLTEAARRLLGACAPMAAASCGGRRAALLCGSRPRFAACCGGSVYGGGPAQALHLFPNAARFVRRQTRPDEANCSKFRAKKQGNL